ncbi:MAG TPA: DUF4331 family protein [Candidatus Eisenbacteria bacterium]|nr:DUF4331 family protein [Candidatus Eisenbacteria bacterium]
MADHGAGPRSTANPEIDISDLCAFPSPERRGNLVMVLNACPFIPSASTLFSDAIDYRLRVRSVRVASTGRKAAFSVGDVEHSFSFTFEVPRKQSDGRLVQSGTCRTPWGEIAVTVGDEAGSRSGGTRIFAGCRLDTFFVDQLFSGGLRMNRRIPEPTNTNSVAGQNVLSLVVEFEGSALFGQEAGSLVGIVAETMTRGSYSARQDRVGRPEVKNFIMMDRASDPVNRDLDVRDLYSEEDGFKLRPDYLGAYRARLNGSMKFYDGLDGKTDWPLDEEGNHPLTELLLADFLVVDFAKPFAEVSYFQIESAMLRGVPHESCGGRWLNDDVVDTVLTLLVNNFNGPRVSDGVDQTTAPATKRFPYLSPPNPNPPPLAPLVGIPK